MASQSECSGSCHMAGEDVAGCCSGERPGATLSTVNSAPENSKSNLSAVNLSLQQSYITDSEVADGTAHNMSASRLSIDDLPDEILIQIFSHMSFTELVDVVHEVCTRWRRLSQDLKLWTDKELQIHWWDCADTHTIKTYRSEQKIIQTFRDFPNLCKVIFQRPSTSRVLRALYSRCRNLSVLYLFVRQKLSYKVLRNFVEKCSRIHTLGICNELLENEKFSELVSHLQHLRVLHLLKNHSENTPVLRPLSDGCPQLEDVNFMFTNLDIDDLRYFLNAKRNTLKSICIKWTMDERKWCVLPLLVVCANSLERLELLYYNVHDNDAREAFIALGKQKNLRELNMSLNPLPPYTAALAFNTGGGLPNLTLLRMEESPGLDDYTMIAISCGCPALRELVVRACEQLSDAAFSQIYRLKHLGILDVSRCSGLGGALIAHLSKLNQLHTLLLEYIDCPKLLPGLGCILEFSGLRCLTLDSSIVTGMPFDKFPGNLVSLRKLNIWHCCGDPKTADVLTERMPGLEIRGRIRSIGDVKPYLSHPVDDPDCEF